MLGPGSFPVIPSSFSWKYIPLGHLYAGAFVPELPVSLLYFPGHRQCFQSLVGMETPGYHVKAQPLMGQVSEGPSVTGHLASQAQVHLFVTDQSSERGYVSE